VTYHSSFFEIGYIVSTLLRGTPAPIGMDFYARKNFTKFACVRTSILGQNWEMTSRCGSASAESLPMRPLSAGATKGLRTKSTIVLTEVCAPDAFYDLIIRENAQGEATVVSAYGTSSRRLRSGSMVAQEARCSSVTRKAIRIAVAVGTVVILLVLAGGVACPSPKPHPIRLTTADVSR